MSVKRRRADETMYVIDRWIDDSYSRMPTVPEYHVQVTLCYPGDSKGDHYAFFNDSGVRLATRLYTPTGLKEIPDEDVPIPQRVIDFALKAEHTMFVDEDGIEMW